MYYKKIAAMVDRKRSKLKTSEPQSLEQDDLLKYYLKDVRKYPLLSPDEEKELTLRMKEGDQKARARLIESNLRLVIKIAKKYQMQGLELIDLIEEGNLGLMKAVDKFEPHMECRFSTYATWWIRQAIERAIINQTRVIRIPVHVSDDMKRIYRETFEFYQKHKREPDIDELAERLGMKPEYVAKLIGYAKKTSSMDSPIKDEEDFSLADTIEDESITPPDMVAENIDNITKVNKWVSMLDEKERKIIIMRYGLDGGVPQTLEVIGKVFKVTRERIRQIEMKALKKLKKMILEDQEANE